MSQLTEQYEKECGASSVSLMCHVYAFTNEYVNWLEAKVEKLTAQNTASPKCLCATCTVPLHQCSICSTRGTFSCAAYREPIAALRAGC
jgi:hypothetical protein